MLIPNLDYWTGYYVCYNALREAYNWSSGSILIVFLAIHIH